MTQRNQKTTVTHVWLISNTKRIGHSSAQFFLAFKTPTTSFTPDALATITDALSNDPLGLLAAICVANYSVWGVNNGKPPSVKAARVDVAMLNVSIQDAGGTMANPSSILDDGITTRIDTHLKQLHDSGVSNPDDFAVDLRKLLNGADL